MIAYLFARLYDFLATGEALDSTLGTIEEQVTE